MEDSMAASIIRMEQEKDELRAEVALLKEEQRILQNTIESLRDALCADKCRDKAAADGNWSSF
jgi:regulator of replication initiation timing